MKYSWATLIAAVALRTDASNPSKADLQRAKTKVPGRSFRGSSFSKASEKLNAALERSLAAPLLASCDELSVSQLQSTIKALIEARHADLSKIYSSTNDARALRHIGVADYEEEWAVAARAGSPNLVKAAHDMMCHEAVMLYVHHLTESQRAAWGLRGEVVLPKLPVGERLFASDSLIDLDRESRSIVDAYLKSTACAACHTDDDGLTPETLPSKDAPKWPPAAEPVIPWRWSANLGGWMDREGQRTNFTGSFHYDYTLNRLKEHWVIAEQGMEIINYWFGAPAPDGEGTGDLPKGAGRGHIYQVTRLGGQMLGCRDHTYPTFSIVRPDAFIKQWHNDADNLHYVGRENMANEDMGGATGWADHWMYADTCGNFSLWNSIESGLPVYTRGPTGCNSGNAGNSYVNHSLSAPEDALFQFDFSVCTPDGAMQGPHKMFWGFPDDALSGASFV